MFNLAITHNHDGLFFWKNVFSLLKVSFIIVYSGPLDSLVFIVMVWVFTFALFAIITIGYVALCWQNMLQKNTKLFKAKTKFIYFHK